MCKTNEFQTWGNNGEIIYVNINRQYFSGLLDVFYTLHLSLKAYQLTLDK